MPNRIAELRHARGLRQSDLAEWLGVARPTVAAWETGAKVPRKAMARQIARTLRVTVDDLNLDPPRHPNSGV